MNLLSGKKEKRKYDKSIIKILAAFYMNQKRVQDVVTEIDGNAPTYALVFDEEQISGDSLASVSGSFYQDFVYAYTWMNKRAPVIIFSEDEKNYYGVTLGYTTDSPNLGIFYTPTRIIKNYENGKAKFNDPGDTAVRQDEEAAAGIGAWSKYAIGLMQNDILSGITRPYEGEQTKTLFGDYSTTPIFEGNMNKYGNTVFGVDFRMEYNDAYETVKVFATFDFSSIGEDTSVTPALKATTREVFLGTFSVADKNKVFGFWGGDESWIESFQFEYYTDDLSCDHDFEQQTSRAGFCSKAEIVLNSCTKCGYEYEETLLVKGHDFVDTLEGNSTENSMFYNHRCKICDFSYVTKVDMFICNHSWEEISNVPVTCLADGYLIRRCLKCEEVENTVYKHYGHEFELFETVEPTEQSKGYYKYFCTVCEEMKMEYIDILQSEDQRVMDGLWCTEVEDQTYTGKAIKPEIKVYYKNTLLRKGKDYTISYKRNVNVNVTLDDKTSPAIVIKGKGRFTGTQSYQFEITAKDIAKTKLFIVIVIAGKGNYNGTVQTSYTIRPADLKSAKISVESKIYTGEEITLEGKDITVKIGKDKLTYGKDYVILDNSYTNNLNKGTASVTIKGIGNYAGYKVVKYKIKSKPFEWEKKLFRIR